MDALGYCSKRRANLNKLFIMGLLLLTLTKVTTSIRFYEICEIGKCNNGGTMYYPDTFWGMCYCICPHPYVGALCDNKLLHPEEYNPKRNPFAKIIMATKRRRANKLLSRRHKRRHKLLRKH